MPQARILIVEDDPDAAHLLENWLRASGYQHIGTATSGQEAIALANSANPDLVIMDIVLPGNLDGIQTADLLLKRFDIPVLYLTAYTNQEFFERARATSPAAYLTKPFNERELGRAVEVALDRHELLRRLKASEAHLAEAQAVAHIGSWHWDLLRDHVTASDELLRLFDLPHGTFEPCFNSFLQCVDVADQPRALQAVAALLNGDEPGDVEVSIPLENERTRVLRIRGSARFDAAGKAFELLGTAHDITNEWRARQKAESYRNRLEERVAQRTADLDAANIRLQAKIAEHLVTEKQLLQSEARYRSLIENLPDAVFVIQDERVAFVNPAATRLAGVENPDELLGKSVASLVQADTWRFIEQRKQAAHTHQKPNPLTSHSLTRSDGSTVEVESTSFAFEFDGHPAFLAVVHDLTERRRIERAAERFRIALDSSSDAIFLIDPAAMRFIDVNETACNSLGYTRMELLDLGPHDIKPLYSKANLRERFAEVLNGNPSTAMIRTVHQRKDGSTFPVEVSLRPFESEGRDLMVVVARDVTARQLAETQLKEANERFQQFAENVSEAFWIRDLEADRFLYVSPAFETLLRHPVSSAYQQPRSFLSVVHPEDRERVAAAFEWQRQNRQGVDLEYRIIVGDDEIRWIWVRTFPIRDAENHVYRMAGVAEDVTQRRESEEQYRTIVQASMDGFLLANAQGRILDCNDAFCRMLGYTRVEMLQLSIPELDHGKSPEQVAEHIQQVIEQGQGRFETRDRHKSGQLIDIEVSAHYQPDSSGGKLFSFVRDISQRKLVEEALRESEERYRAVVEDQTELICRLRHDGTFIFVNEVFCRFFGRTADELVGHTWHPVAFPEDLPQIEAKLGTLSPSNPVVVIENRVLSGTGKLYWMQFVNRGFFDSKGQVVEIQSVGRDITDRKQAELALRRSEARSRSILRAAPVGIGVLVDRVIQEVNPAMTHITGYSSEELLGQSARMLYPTQPDFDHVGTEKYGQIKAYGIGSVETRWRRKDGGIIDIALSSSPIVADDLAQGVTFTAQDITATKQAEQARLEHEARQRNALVREVHHRIKNNLQGVIGLLRQHIASQPDIQQPIEAAITQINTVAVVHGLQSRIPQQELRLRELLNEVNSAAAALAMVPRLPPIEDTLTSDVWLETNAAVTIALILNELIHNALKHGLHADGTGVAIVLSGDGKLATIRISNPGGPLPANLDLSTGQGCGTGLDLIRTLLPRYGAQLNLYENNGNIDVELVLSPPVSSSSEHAVGMLFE